MYLTRFTSIAAHIVSHCPIGIQEHRNLQYYCILFVMYSIKKLDIPKKEEEEEET